MSILKPPSKEHLFHSKRAGAVSINKFTMLIDGRYTTTRALAEELGLTISQMSERLRRERNKPGPVTMEGLRAEK